MSNSFGFGGNCTSLIFFSSLIPCFIFTNLPVFHPKKVLMSKNPETLREPIENQLKAIEPTYENIPPGMLRRMGKAVRMGVGVALPLVKQTDSIIDGIIIGTANGGMEDCIKIPEPDCSIRRRTANAGKLCSKHTQCNSRAIRVIE